MCAYKKLKSVQNLSNRNLQQKMYKKCRQATQTETNVHVCVKYKKEI